MRIANEVFEAGFLGSSGTGLECLPLTSHSLVWKHVFVVRSCNVPYLDQLLIQLCELIMQDTKR